MIRILFLLLIVMSSIAFAQTEETPKAWKYDEFETATNGFVKMRMDALYVELSNNPSAQGIIINYGSAREIAVRERQIRDSIRFRRFDASRITMVNGGFDLEVKSQFWIVPAGAENPPPEATTAQKIDEFSQIPQGELKARLDSFFVTMGNSPDSSAYIVNYGTARVVVRLETQIKNYVKFRNSDLSRLKFKRANSTGALRTQFWLAPAVKQ